LSLAVAVAGSAACSLIAGLSDEYSTPRLVSDAAPADAPIVDVASTDVRSEDAFDAGLPASCSELLARDPRLLGNSGTRDIYPGGRGVEAPVHVFCEMSVDDGGWTLIGRSSNLSHAFGWTTNTGTLTDPGPAYSIDVVALGLAFREVMISTRDPFQYIPADHAYKLTVPDNFATAYLDAAFATTNVVTLVGGCVPEGGPRMLSYLGLTAGTDGFFFRDNPQDDFHTGLVSTAFDVLYSDCPAGGELNGRQGLIFVR
jgi:hypothetical protein